MSAKEGYRLHNKLSENRPGHVSLHRNLGHEIANATEGLHIEPGHDVREMST
jgi:hypothetical protein